MGVEEEPAVEQHSLPAKTEDTVQTETEDTQVVEDKQQSKLKGEQKAVAVSVVPASPEPPLSRRMVPTVAIFTCMA
jgi:hypothetical protein